MNFTIIIDMDLVVFQIRNFGSCLAIVNFFIGVNQ